MFFGKVHAFFLKRGTRDFERRYRVFGVFSPSGVSPESEKTRKTQSGISLFFVVFQSTLIKCFFVILV